MSELTECNYCRYQRVKARARAKKYQLVEVKNKSYQLSGVNIYMLPPNMTKEEFLRELDCPGGRELHDKWFITWYMELTDHCVCCVCQGEKNG